MPVCATSSRQFSAALTPVGCEPEWRIALLSVALAASALLTIVLVPAPARFAPLAALLGAAAFEYAMLVLRPPRPDRLRLFADGRLAVTFGARPARAELLPGGLVTSGFAWLCWRRHGDRRRHWTLARRADNPASWRRARLVWRWGRRPGRRDRLV